MQPGDIVFYVCLNTGVVKADVIILIDSPAKFRGLKNGWQYTRDWHPTLDEAIQYRAMRLEQEQASLRRYIRNYHNTLKQINERIAAGPPAVPEGFAEEQKKSLAEEYKNHYNKKPAINDQWANF